MENERKPLSDEAELLALLRSRLGLTYRQMGERLGIGQQYAYELEAGRKPFTGILAQAVSYMAEKEGVVRDGNPTDDGG